MGFLPLTSIFRSLLHNSKEKTEIVKSFTGVVTSLGTKYVSAILITEDNKTYNVDINLDVIPIEYHKYLAIGVKLAWEVIKQDGGLYPKLRILVDAADTSS